MMTTRPALPRAGELGDWFGQPRGLTILFLTEMWVQFSFYGMRALLVLYMTKQLAFSQQGASWVYGLYAAAVYATPIVGGAITDRWLGRRRAVILGGIIMALGHFAMAFEPLLYFALALIALGNGFFLPSLASQIDGLYAADDRRRKSAYNVYYVGVNLGAFLAPLAIGSAGELLGFDWGFAMAGLGMLVGLATYLSGQRYLKVDPSRTNAADTGPTTTGRELRSRLLLLGGITVAVVIFRGGYEQLGNTLALWFDQGVNRQLTAGPTIPVTWFQSLNPLMVFVLSPIFIAYWTRTDARKRGMSSVGKMIVGALIVAASFAMLAGLTALPGRLVGWPWAALFVILMTAGELWILPVGLGLFGRMAPKGLQATTIALWFSAGFLGNIAAAWIGTFWSSVSHAGFFVLAASAILASAVFLAALLPTAAKLERGATN
jgi:POT family proton-dependent oligopeptide transporter